MRLPDSSKHSLCSALGLQEDECFVLLEILGLGVKHRKGYRTVNDASKWRGNSVIGRYFVDNNSINLSTALGSTSNLAISNASWAAFTLVISWILMLSMMLFGLSDRSLMSQAFPSRTSTECAIHCTMVSQSNTIFNPYAATASSAISMITILRLMAMKESLVRRLPQMSKIHSLVPSLVGYFVSSMASPSMPWASTLRCQMEKSSIDSSTTPLPLFSVMMIMAKSICNLTNMSPTTFQKYLW